MSVGEFVGTMESKGEFCQRGTVDERSFRGAKEKFVQSWIDGEVVPDMPCSLYEKVEEDASTD